MCARLAHFHLKLQEPVLFGQSDRQMESDTTLRKLCNCPIIWFADFREFMCSLSISTRGTMEQKLRWAFSIYDVNGDGYITKQEMFRIVDALYRTMGDNPDEDEQAWEELTPEERTLKVFRRFDTNKDGVLSLQEFVEGARNDKTLALILEKRG